MRALFQIKRNLSESCSSRTRRNAYIGYVVPILVYGSQTWQPNTTQQKELESSENCSAHSDKPYKELLENLQLLPISLYIELHDILLFVTILKDKYDVNWEKLIGNQLCDGYKRPAARGDFKISKHRLQKCDEGFVNGGKIFANLFMKTLNIDAKVMDKKMLTNIYWKLFRNFYDPERSCTWQILCKWGSCRETTKPIT